MGRELDITYQPAFPRILLLLLVGALVVAGCDRGEVDPETTTTSSSDVSTTVSPTTAPGETTTTQAGPNLGQSCIHEEREVTIAVRYPDGWHSDRGDAATPCSAFDPEPFQLQRGTEYPPDLAVVVRVEPVSFERASRRGAAKVEDERRTQIDGRQAVRLQVVSTGEGLRPEGERSIQWVVDGGDERSILAHTSEVEGNDFEESQRVLDDMVAAFDIQPRR